MMNAVLVRFFFCFFVGLGGGGGGGEKKFNCLVFFSFFLSFRRGIRPKEEGGDWDLGQCTCIYVTFCKICKETILACVRSGEGGGWCN